MSFSNCGLVFAYSCICLLHRTTDFSTLPCPSQEVHQKCDVTSGEPRYPTREECELDILVVAETSSITSGRVCVEYRVQDTQVRMM